LTQLELAPREETVMMESRQDHPGRVLQMWLVVEAFRARPIDDECPYVWLAAKHAVISLTKAARNADCEARSP
jgi:hypothetical protein